MQTEKQCTVLLIDDSAEDRATYCRYLQRGSSHAYQVLEAGSAVVGLDLYQRLLPDAILLDYSLPDMDGLEFLAVMPQAGKHVPVLMLTGQGDETIAAQAIKRGAQDYLIKGTLTADGLCKALDQAIEQWQLQHLLQQQEQQQQMLSAIALRIRQSLTLQTILDTSVAAVRQYLNADRVVIYQFAPDMSGQIVAEAVLPEWIDSLHTQIEDTCFRETLGGEYRLGRTQAIADIHAAGLTDCHIQLLERFQVKANLVVPLLITDQHSDSAEPHHDAALPQLWGLLVAHQCSTTRHWQPFETDLLNQVAVQMAIAIQQAELYRQLQKELADRQEAVQSLQASTAALALSEQRYRSLVTATTQAIWTADPEGKTTEAIPGWRALTGQTEAETQDWRWMDAIHPDDRAKTVEAWRIATITKQLYAVEHRVRTTDGSYKFFVGRAAPVLDEAGNIREWIGAHTDISDRKQMELALRDSERRLRLALDFTQIASWDWNLLTNQLTWNGNHIRLLGLTPQDDETTYQTWRKRVHPDDLERVESAIQQALATQTRYVAEYRVCHPDGSLRWLLGKGQAIYNEMAQPMRVLGVIFDITAQKQAEITMQQLNQELETRVQKRTAKLQAGKVRLREAQRIAHVGDWEFALASQTITWSEELFRLFGLDTSQGEPEYAEHMQSYVPESRLQLEHAVQQAATLGTPYELELQFSRADGSVRWLLARGEAIRDVDGAIVKLLGTALDITDRKQAEEQLRHLSDRLTLAVKSGAIAIWDWNITENILTWDDRMYELYGITPDRFTSVYDAWASSLHPDDLLLAETAIQRALTGEKDYDPEFRVIHPDGTVHFIKAYALVQRNEQGEPQQMIGINYDITDRKQSELENQQLKERLQFVLASNPAVIFTCEPDGDYAATFISDNIQTVTGYTPTEFLSEPGFWAKHLHPEDAPHIFDNLANLFEQGHHTHEYRFLHKDGSYRWMRDGLRLVRDAHDNAIEIVGYFVDITDRKQAEQALQQLTIDLQRSNQELEQFAYVASHDLQEPLRAITSYTQLLAKRYQGQLDEKADKYIYYVVDGAARMQQLIQDLLAYSRVGRYELKLQPTGCNAILEQVRNALQVAIAESNAVITVEALPTISADTAQVTQLFQNLIGNAIKYRGQATPLINVSAKQQGKEWAFSIQDNGIGIEPQYAERIFEIFQRLHTRREYEGTGLGLAICKKIVERHHGRIWVESTLGQGAAFCFTLPASLNHEYSFIEKE